MDPQTFNSLVLSKMLKMSMYRLITPIMELSYGQICISMPSFDKKIQDDPYRDDSSRLRIGSTLPV